MIDPSVLLKIEVASLPLHALVRITEEPTGEGKQLSTNNPLQMANIQSGVEEVSAMGECVS